MVHWGDDFFPFGPAPPPRHPVFRYFSNNLYSLLPVTTGTIWCVVPTVGGIWLISCPIVDVVSYYQGPPLYYSQRNVVVSDVRNGGGGGPNSVGSKE